MLENQNRSKLFNFALKAQNFSGMIISLVILWSVWALFFTEIDNILIARVILSALCLALAVIAPLIDFNESHATNPLWTGHARFHLVWQVNAMIITAILSLVMLWAYYSFSNHLIVILLNFLWIISFYASVLGMKLYDGELNDINGVPPVLIKILGREYEIDRNIQAITGGLFVNSYAVALFFV